MNTSMLKKIGAVVLCITATLAASAVTRTWKSSVPSGAWYTAANWEGGVAPGGDKSKNDIAFPANGNFSVTTGSAIYGHKFSIGANTTVNFTLTSGTTGFEHYFDAPSSDYTLLANGASLIVDKPSNRASNYLRLSDDQRDEDGVLCYIRNNTTLEARNGAKIKVYGVDYVGSSNVYFHANNGGLSIYSRDLLIMTAANEGFRAVAEGTKGNIQLTGSESDDMVFQVPGMHYTFECKNGATFAGSKLHAAAGVGTVRVTGSGSEMKIHKVTLNEPGSLVEVSGNAYLNIYKNDFSVGNGTVLSLSGSLPFVEMDHSDTSFDICAGAIVRLAPEMTWPQNYGRIDVNGNATTTRVYDDVLYEIDTSAITGQKTFCLVSATNTWKTVPAKRSYVLPKASNVRLVGTNASNYTATFTKDTYRLYVTLSPRENETITGGTSEDITVAGVDYRVLKFTDTNSALSWNVPSGVTEVDLLMVGGGGAGGPCKNASGTYYGAGGGGGGGVIYKQRLPVVPGSTFNFTIGKGGTASTTTANKGGATTLANTGSSISLTADGGGNGAGLNGTTYIAAGNGASGGGGLVIRGQAASYRLGGLANGLGMGCNGGSGYQRHEDSFYREAGGSGGGACSAGMTPKNLKGVKAGMGFHCDITGAIVCYGGGGGGATTYESDQESSSPMAGGGGVGGDGDAGEAGTDGLGGGGGGASCDASHAFAGGKGGSGVVIIRYVTNYGSTQIPTSLSPNGTEVALHNAGQKEYLAMTSSQRRTKFTDSTWRSNISKEQGDCLPLPVTFSWTSGGYNTLTIRNADGSVFLQKEVLGNSTKVTGFDIGTNYTWTVSNQAGTSVTATFTTENEFPRMIQDPGFDLKSNCTRKLVGVVNVRDLGGLTGLNGRRVKSGLMFRTGRFNETASYSREPYNEPGESYVRTAAASNYWCNVLGIKTEVDLRDADEFGSNAVNSVVGPLGPSVEYVHYTADPSHPQKSCPLYTNIFENWGKIQAKRYLDVLLDPSKYPLAFHCSAGKDRTGTLAYILEAILGVDDNTKELDWSLLVFSTTDTQFNYTAYFDPMVAGFNSYSGSTINEKVVNYVKDIGVTDAQIATFRAAMLEELYVHVHAWTDWTATTPATCTTAGVESRHCTASGCSDPDETRPVAALGHDLGAWTIFTAPQVGAAGEKRRSCSRCDYYESQTIPAINPSSHPYVASWTGGGSDIKWSTAANWNVVPTAADDVFFSGDSSFYVDVTGYSKTSPMVKNLSVAAGATVTFDPDISADGHTFYGTTMSLGAGSTLSIFGHDARVNDCSGSLGANSTLYIGNGNSFYTYGLDGAATGSKIVLDGGVLRSYEADNSITLGSSASTLVIKGDEPQLKTTSSGGSITLGSNLTVQLVPELSWSAVEGVVYGEEVDSVITVDSGIHYEIDITKLGALATPKTFAFASVADGNTAAQGLAVPSDGNVTLTGTNAEDYQCSFAVSGKLMTFTIGLKPNPAEATVAPAIVYPNNVVVDTHTDAQKEFLAKSDAERRACYTDSIYRSQLRSNGGAPRMTTFSWTGDGLCTVTIKRSYDQKTVFSAQLIGNSVDVDQFEIACTYNWSVANALGTAYGTFTTSDEAPRLLRNPGSVKIKAIRDIGGRIGLNGKRVRQNAIFRSSQFNKNSENYITDENRSFWLNDLGIKTDLDLRQDSEKGSYASSSPFGSSVEYCTSEISSYDEFFESAQEFKAAFDVLFNTNKFPVVFHCVAGRDRTGCVAYFVNALLGVDEQELLKDWEANAFADSSVAFNHMDCIDWFIPEFVKKAPSGTAAQRAAAWAKFFGYTDAQIAAFRNYMLVDDVEPPAFDPDVATVAPAIVAPNGIEVETHTDLQLAFLAKNEVERRSCFSDINYRTTIAQGGSGSEPKPTRLSWTGDGRSYVTVKRASDNKVVFTYAANANAVDVDQLEIACSYIWSVSNSVGVANGTFTTAATAPRLLRNPGSNEIHGIRDLGGRIGLDGKRVKQNLIFRSSELNGKNGSNITDVNRSFWLDFLGIKTDLDFRSEETERYTFPNSSPLGNTVTYVGTEMSSYAKFFKTSWEVKVALDTVFNSAKYPIVFHCVAGQDRTGSLAYLLNAVLGVDEQELIKDWEVTIFWNTKSSFSHGDRIDKFRQELTRYAPNGTVCDQAYNFLLSLGYSEDRINAFRNQMLEGGYTAPIAKTPATGGWTSTYTLGGTNFNVVAYTNTASVQSWTVPEGVTSVDLLVVGGGGAGGGIFYKDSAKDVGAGGGGAGGFNYVAAAPVAAGQVLNIKVGAGGTATSTTSNKGGSSYVSNTVWTAGILSAGGGAGASWNSKAATSGASGGGGCGTTLAAAAASGVGTGNAGGAGGVYPSNWVGGGGGGGSRTVGGDADQNDGGNGGDGLECEITGEHLCYAGGGAGAGGDGPSGSCGAGGGGAGGYAGIDGFGGGGGGESSFNATKAGKRGGSGIVIIRYTVGGVTPPAPHVHTWDSGFETTPPTCIAAGVKTYTCTDCNQIPAATYTEPIPALGHNLGDWYTFKAAEVGVAGEKRRDCSRCEYYESEEIPALDPDPVDPQPSHPYTATWTGNGSDINWSTAANWNWAPTAVDSVLFNQNCSFVSDLSGYSKNNTMIQLVTIADGVTVTLDPEAADNGHSFYAETLRVGAGATFNVVGHDARANDCEGALAANSTLYVGNGNSFYTYNFDNAGAGAKIVLDNGIFRTYDGEHWVTFGDKAATLELKGAAPQLKVEGWDCELELGANLTVKLVPEASWSDSVGVVYGSKDSSTLSISSGIHYEIDVSKLGSATLPKTFCFASVVYDNEEDNSIAAPAAANVTVTGTNASAYECAFSVVGDKLLFTVSASSVVHVHTWGDWEVYTPAQPGVPGEKRRYCTDPDCDEYESEVIPALPVSGLPEGYVAVEYIESGANQFVNTGIPAQDNISAKIDYEYNSYNSRGAYMLAANGLNNSNARNNRCYLACVSASGAWRSAIGSGSIANIEGIDPLALHTRYVTESSINGATFTTSVSNCLTGVCQSGNRTYSELTEQPSATTLTLFAIHTDNYDYFTDARLYGCEITTNSVLARKFVPCYEEATLRYGLYDTVGGKFYRSATGFDFSGASVVPNAVLTAGAESGGHIPLTVSGLDTAMLLVAGYGKLDGGENLGGWENVAPVTVLEKGATAYSYELPSGWGTDYTKIRFFLTVPSSVPMSKLQYITANQAGQGASTPQYIDTGFWPSTNTSCMADVKLSSVAAQSRVFETPSGPSSGYLLFHAYVNGTGYPSFANCKSTVSGPWTQICSAKAATSARVQWTVDAKGKAAYYNIYGTKDYTKTHTPTMSNIAGGSLRLLWSQNNPSGVGNIYGSEIKENNVAKRYFVPATAYKNATTVVPGLYDTINGRFFPSAGSAEFVAGPDATVAFRPDDLAKAPVLVRSSVCSSAQPAPATMTASIRETAGGKVIDATVSASTVKRWLVAAWDSADRGANTAAWANKTVLATVNAGDTQFTGLAVPATAEGFLRVFLVTPGADASDYVQDGLVMQFDAIENGGAGVHVADTNVWVNLKDSTKNFTSKDFVFGAKEVRLSSRENATKPTAAANLAANVDKTAEVVCHVGNDFFDHYNPNSLGTIFSFCGDGHLVFRGGDCSDANFNTWINASAINNGGTRMPLYVRSNNGTTNTNCKRTTITWPASYSYDMNASGNGTSLSVGNAAYLSCDSNPDNITANSSTKYFYKGTSANSHTANVAIGCNRGDVFMSSIRVYSRKLTSAEKTRNYRIDSLRYLGGTVDTLDDASIDYITVEAAASSAFDLSGAVDPIPAEIAEALSGDEIVVPGGATVSVSDNGATLTVNGKDYSTKAHYVFVQDDGVVTLVIAPAEAVVTSIAVDTTDDDQMLVGTVQSVLGFRYRVIRADNLQFTGATYGGFQNGTGEPLSITAPKSGPKQFYKLEITDQPQK